jgi:hypothetical protein
LRNNYTRDQEPARRKRSAKFTYVNRAAETFVRNVTQQQQHRAEIHDDDVLELCSINVATVTETYVEETTSRTHLALKRSTSDLGQRTRNGRFAEHGEDGYSGDEFQQLYLTRQNAMRRINSCRTDHIYIRRTLEPKPVSSNFGPAASGTFKNRSAFFPYKLNRIKSIPTPKSHF